MKHSVGLQIFFWSEIVIAARILIFTLPVISNKLINKNFSLGFTPDLYLILLTVGSCMFLALGIVALLNVKAWKLLHYVAAIVTVALALYAGNQAATVIQSNV